MKLGRSSKQEKPDGTAGPTGMDKPEKLAGPGRQGRQAGLEKQDELNDQERWAGPNRRVKQSNSSWEEEAACLDRSDGKRQSLEEREPDWEDQMHQDSAHISSLEMPEDEAEHSHFFLLFGSPESETAGDMNSLTDCVT